ncbi:zinc finger domain-containing protein [Mycolicibacterium komossense]|uniref:zinc finger domain-containing protein n=1 Tax=Mycolicibacterium komossense TaxID=1779 RepID=UPI003F4982AE
MRYGDGKTKGQRLADRRDPVVRGALKRRCPDCNSKPDEWCVGIAENSRTKGRRRSRLHFARCHFTAEEA